MSNNAQYWANKDQRAKAAEEHHKLMEERYSGEIERSVRLSRVYSHEDMINFLDNKASKDQIDAYLHDKPVQTDNEPEVYIMGCDTVKAAFTMAYGRTAILNFASYKEPGGMFMAGSKAQEECLCHESTLYEVLSRKPEYYEWNKKNLNRALYLDRAIASPDVVFTHPKNFFLSEIKKFDVITCAAPNASAYLRYNKDNGEIERALESRIRFLKFIVEEASGGKINTLILGAFGCGVFGLDPTMVAKMFKKYFSTSTAKRIVYAILDENSENYKAFERELS